MIVRVATWNMDHWKRTSEQRRRAWDLLRESGWDAALLQEAVPASDVGRQDLVWREIGGYRRFGSGVLSISGWPIEELTTTRSYFEPVRAFPVIQALPGSVAVARVRPHGVRPVVLVSVYGVIDGYAAATVLRQVADVMPLFDSVDGDRIVLGGDLNVSTQWSGSEGARSRAALNAVESLGLVDLMAECADRPSPIGDACECGQGAECRHVGTFGGGDGPATAQLDYLFATEPLARECVSVRVHDVPSTWECSDHCPVVAEFDLQPSDEPEAWDERFLDDVSTTLRAVLHEDRDWGVFTPGHRSPKLQASARRTWILVYWQGSLPDGRRAQLELGVWREPDKTGHPQVAHAGLLGETISERIDDLRFEPAPQAPSGMVSTQYANYIVTPFTEEGDSLADALRRSLTLLTESARLGS